MTTGVARYVMCSRCKRPSLLIISDEDGHEYASCDCAMPAINIYINHCWNCGFGIDSRTSIKSLLPGMGYHCGGCGKDLTEWKQSKGLNEELWKQIPCLV